MASFHVRSCVEPHEALDTVRCGVLGCPHANRGPATVRWLDQNLSFCHRRLPPRSPCVDFFGVICAQVTCFEYASQLLPREDPDAAKCLEKALLRDGVEIRLGESVPLPRVKHAVLFRAGLRQVQVSCPECRAVSAGSGDMMCDGHSVR